MREIKFRAWNGEVGKFLDEGFSISMDGTSLYFEDCEEIFLGDYPEIVIEQLTGLKDKNGKEIYEGDFVLFPKHYVGDRFIESHYERICFENGSFNTTLCGVGYADYPHWCEVIGNIHENPELVPVKL